MVTRLDDEIYEHTMRVFPELSEPPHEKLVRIDEDWMKSADGKKRWRGFIEEYVTTLSLSFLISFSTRYKEKVKDYNFGSLIRMDAKGEYGEANTIFGAYEL
jgi:hypothetical protein